MSTTGHWRSRVHHHGQRIARRRSQRYSLAMPISMNNRVRKLDLGRGSRRKHLRKLRENFHQGSRDIMLSAVGTEDDSERSP